MNYDKIIIQWALVFKHMHKTFLFAGYLRRISNYLERITLFNLTHMMSMIDLVAISVEALRIDSVLFREIIHFIDPYESLNVIIPNPHSS